MREIPLTQGKVAIVDDEDYEYLNQFKWTAGLMHNIWYAVCHIHVNGKDKTIYMHTVILGTPKGMQSDHKNGDGLDNRRENLRICTHTQNLHNQRKQIGPTSSRFKGVSWNNKRRRWAAQISPYRQHIVLGFFNFEIDAAKAYNKAAIEHFGEFARLNEVN